MHTRSARASVVYYARSLVLALALVSLLGVYHVTTLVRVLPPLQHSTASPVAVHGVFSTTSKHDQHFRQLHRTTYFQSKAVCNSFQASRNCSILSYFIFGQPSSRKEWEELHRENQTYHDIIVLDIKENMNQGKTYMWWKYAATHFPTSQFYLKTDLDTFVWMTELHHQLKIFQHNRERFIYYGRYSCGHRIGCSKGQRFISGGFQLLSSDLVFWITDPLNLFVQKRITGYEDLITGEWLHVGHRFAHLHSPCPNQIEDMHHVFQSKPCGKVFMHWLKEDRDFLDLWNGKLDQVIERKNSVL